MKILLKITFLFFLFLNVSNADLIKPNSNIHEESTRTFKRDNLGFILIECPHRMLLLKIEQHLNLRKLKQDKQLAMPKKILKLVEDVHSLTKPINLKTLLY